MSLLARSRPGTVKSFSSQRLTCLARQRARLSQVCNASKYFLVPNGDGTNEHINATFEEVGVSMIELSKGAYEVGRTPETAEVCLPIPTVSSRHALLRLDDNNVLSVTDLGSTNGTYVNGKELEPQQEVCVRVGEEIVFGDSHLASFLLVEDDSFSDAE